MLKISSSVPYPAISNFAPNTATDITLEIKYTKTFSRLKWFLNTKGTIETKKFCLI